MALLLAKPLIVIAVRLGAVLVSVPQKGEPQATFSDAMLGVAIILLAGLLPGVIYRFSGGLMATSAGAPPRATGGVTGQSAQSVQSSMDMTRMIMERNAPRPALAATPRGAGAPARAPARRPQPAARGLGAGVGGAAGPLGLVAVGSAMVGGAVESGGRWLAGQAATGGGVLGDVEAPHVPSPPISRMGHLPPQHPARAADAVVAASGPGGGRPAAGTHRRACPVSPRSRCRRARRCRRAGRLSSFPARSSPTTAHRPRGTAAPRRRPCRADQHPETA